MAEIRAAETAAGRDGVHVFGDLVVFLDADTATAQKRLRRLDDRAGADYRSDALIFAGIDSNHESVGEPSSFDFQVAFEKLELLREWDLLDSHIFKGQPQQVAEARNHHFGSVRIVMHQGRDRVQGVEEKVRIELHLQRL